MTIAGSLSGAVLLHAIGVMASVLSHSKSPEKAPDKNAPSPVEQEPIRFRPGLRDEVEVLREEHQVALVDQKDEGADVAKLPVGVYGFTYSPLHATPMFRKRATQSFEVHKLPDGGVHLVGFVTESEASRLSVMGEQSEVHVYPEPREDAFIATSILVSRIQSFRGPSRSDGNALWLVVG